MTAPRPAPGAQPAAEDDAACWREASRLRHEHPRWIIIWRAQIRQFRAYRRLPGARRDTALTASTPDELADLITQAEQAARPAARPPKDRT